jgi:hypothetical protein
LILLNVVWKWSYWMSFWTIRFLDPVTTTVPDLGPVWNSSFFACLHANSSCLGVSNSSGSAKKDEFQFGSKIVRYRANVVLGPVYMFIWRRVTRQGELLAQAGQTSALFIWNRWRRNGATTHKEFKSFETLKKNITKCLENTRISAEKFRKTYLTIRTYFWAIRLYFKCKAHTFHLGRPSYPGKVFTW